MHVVDREICLDLAAQVHFVILINSFPFPDGVSVQVWSKSNNWFRRQSADNAHFLQSL